MERVAFLIESTGTRIGCLLNPETLTVVRQAGIERRQSTAGPLHGADLSDDPLLYAGGGSTEMTLDLLFDTTLATGSSIVAEDVRDLTRPLWDLAENAADDSSHGQPAVVRFVWGRAWNVPGVIAAAAQRLESFTEAGVPRRAWLRLRMLRVTPPDAGRRDQSTTVPDLERVMTSALGNAPAAPASARSSEIEHTVEIAGGSAAGDSGSVSSPTRLDDLAQRYLGDPARWRLIAWFNDISDPLRMTAGRLLHVPPGVAHGGTR
jgi:hypothetical protein